MLLRILVPSLIIAAAVSSQEVSMARIFIGVIIVFFVNLGKIYGIIKCMKGLKFKFLVLVVAGFLMMSGFGSPVWAAGNCGGVKTNIISCSDENGVLGIISLVLTILSFGIGALATFGIVIEGIRYMTAQDNMEQIKTAKKRIFQIVVGLLAYAMLWAFVNWLVPGGIFSSGRSWEATKSKGTEPAESDLDRKKKEENKKKPEKEKADIRKQGSEDLESIKRGGVNNENHLQNVHILAE